MFDLVRQYDEANFVLSASCSSQGKGEVMREDGLVGGHAYSLLQAVELPGKEGARLRLLQLRNPWGSQVGISQAEEDGREACAECRASERARRQLG